MKNSSASRNYVVVLTAVVLMLCAPTLSRAALVAVWGDSNYDLNVVPGGFADVKAVAGGGNHSLALRGDGTVVAWGHNFNGQANVPTGLSNVVAIAAGASYSLALVAGGRIVVWGQNSSGQSVSPPGLSNVVAISAGIAHNLALQSDGRVVAWGWNDGGQTNVPNGLTNAIAISAGASHSLALTADGRVIAWGDNFYSQTNVPAGLTNVVGIAAGYYFNLALLSDGSVRAWGNNEYGQTNIPTNMVSVTAIAAGFAHGLALQSDGAVSAWGLNNYDQGNAILGLSNVMVIAAGSTHNLALVYSGPIRIMKGPQSQEVSYTSNATFSVVAVGAESLSYQWRFNGQPLSNTARISGTTNSTLTISNAQFSDIGIYTVVISNAFGSVVSTDATLTVISPPFITSRTADQTVGAGTSVSLAATASGTPQLSYQWMLNGTNLPGRTLNSLSFPDAQPSNAGIYSLIISNAYGVISTNIALTVTNTTPYFAQLPTLTATNLRTALTSPLAIGSSAALSVAAKGSTPLSYQWRFNGVDIPGATNTTLLFNQLRYDQSGYYNVEASNAFGSTNSAKILLNVTQVIVAGPSFSGNTNTPLSLSNVVAVAGGGSHVLALKSDGTVRTWMANANFVFDSTAYAVTNVPTAVTNVIAIAAGRDHCLALRSNGTVVAWGGNNFGQTNVPSAPGAVALTNVISIAAGSYRSYAVQSDGTVRGWGNQPAVPVGLSNVVAMACGPSQNLALKRDGTVIAWATASTSLASVPPGLSNVIAIVASSSQNQALRRDGTVVTWTSASGFSIVMDGNNFLSNAVATSRGGEISLILKQDGTIAITGFEKSSLSVTTTISAIAAGGVQSGFAVMVIGDGSPNFTLHPYSQIVQRSNTVQLHARAVGVQPMRYQWLLDNLPLPGATNVSLILSNVLGKDTGAYRMIASNALGVVSSQIANITMPFSTNLPAALNTNTWLLFSERTSSWSAQNRETHDGDVAAQSGATTNSGQSILQTTITGPGTLTFWWKVSSEEGFDFLRFYLDNLNSPVVSISGEMEWQKLTFPIGTGAHTMRWVYSKDGSVSAGRDAGWLDDVAFTPVPPTASIQPAILTANAGSNVSFFATTFSDAKPVNYQWMRFGTNLAGATNQTLSVPGVGRKDRGSYSVRVGNTGGSVTTSNATLYVSVPQRLGFARRMADGSMEIFSRDSDGGALSSSDLPLFEAQASTDLIQWLPLPDVLSVTNGSLVLRDPEAVLWPRRFYRVVEH